MNICSQLYLETRTGSRRPFQRYIQRVMRTNLLELNKIISIGNINIIGPLNMDSLKGLQKELMKFITIILLLYFKGLLKHENFKVFSCIAFSS